MTPKSLVCLLLLLSFGQTSFAQESIRSYEVDKIRFVGNETLRDDLLLAVIQTRETPMGIWKFLYKISEKLGDKPELFDPLAFEADYERLKSFYQDQGFFGVAIDTNIVLHHGAKAVELTIRVHEGQRSYIDSITFVGFDHLPSVLTEEIELNPLFKIGDPFIMDHVIAERGRIVNAFFNNGYVDVRVDSVPAYRFASTNNIKVVFAFTRGNRYQFGDVRVEQDSTVAERVTEEVILRHLDFRKGDFFSDARKVDSERNLNRLGVFEGSKVEPVVASKSDSLMQIPISVFVRPRPFQELVPEIGINDENNAFNIQFGIGYNNRNFLGGARNSSAKLRLQVQSIQDIEFSRVFGGTGLRDSSVLGTAEISAKIIQPFFFNNRTTFTPSLSYLVEKKTKLFYNPILVGRIAVASQLAKFTTGSIEWNIERIGFEPIDPTRGPQLLDELSIDRRPVFNSIIALTMQRDKRNDVFNPSSGFVHSGSIEEAGLLPSAFGSLFGSGLPYSTYYKLSALGQWYWDPSGEHNVIWALRLRGGFAQLYGNSPAKVPITRRFYGGGSGRVRGGKGRDLGAVRDPSQGGTALFEGNLEARWNPLRNAGKIGFVEFNRMSFVFFYDIGNVWPEVKQMRLSEVAMAAGLGLRYDTVAGPVRIDLGFRIYDPATVAGRRWITQKKFIVETVSNFVPHIGIGHAF